MKTNEVKTNEVTLKIKQRTGNTDSMDRWLKKKKENKNKLTSYTQTDAIFNTCSTWLQLVPFFSFYLSECVGNDFLSMWKCSAHPPQTVQQGPKADRWQTQNRMKQTLHPQSVTSSQSYMLKLASRRQTFLNSGFDIIGTGLRHMITQLSATNWH